MKWKNRMILVKCVTLFFICYTLYSQTTDVEKIIGGEGKVREKGGNRGFQRVTNDGSLYVYSAYYDPRDEPHLRVSVICTESLKVTPYTCKIRLKNGEHCDVHGVFSTLRNYLHPRYISGVVKCPVTPRCGNADHLDSVSIYPTITSVDVTNHGITVVEHELSILFPGKKTNTLTRCYPPIHSTYNRTHKLIWNIEISKLTGVDKFIFYNHSISPEVDKVLRHYINDGVAEVRVWNIPVSGKQMIFNFGQVTAIHDCLMSEMFVGKYVLLADIDEIVLPRKGLSLVTLANDVFDYHADKPQSKLGSVPFQCLSFISTPRNETKKIADEQTVAERLQIEPLLKTKYFFPYIESRKALVIPERIETMGIHYAVTMRKDFKQLKPHLKDGVMLHFRDKPIFVTSSFYIFKDMLKYSHKIIPAIDRKTKLIFP